MRPFGVNSKGEILLEMTLLDLKKFSAVINSLQTIDRVPLYSYLFAHQLRAST